MKNLITKLTVILFSAVFAALVLSTFVSDRLIALSFRSGRGVYTPEEKLVLVNTAIKLDPLNAENHFRKFMVLQDIRVEKGLKRPHKTELYAIKDAINLRPLWPKYHLYYGLILEMMNPDPNIMTRQLILSELEKASSLKPYSALYKEKYAKYLKKYGN